jgi:hypothetical protein
MRPPRRRRAWGPFTPPPPPPKNPLPEDTKRGTTSPVRVPSGAPGAPAPRKPAYAARAAGANNAARACQEPGQICRPVTQPLPLLLTDDGPRRGDGLARRLPRRALGGLDVAGQRAQGRGAPGERAPVRRDERARRQDGPAPGALRMVGRVATKRVHGPRKGTREDRAHLAVRPAIRIAEAVERGGPACVADGQRRGLLRAHRVPVGQLGAEGMQVKGPRIVKNKREEHAAVDAEDGGQSRRVHRGVRSVSTDRPIVRLTDQPTNRPGEGGGQLAGDKQNEGRAETNGRKAHHVPATPSQ